jgi:GDPmannose 4,6-dehydratase
MLQQEQARDYVIATGTQFSVRQFIERSAAELGMQLHWQGAGVDEVALWMNPSNLALERSGQSAGPVPVIRIDPRYFRPAEVQTLLGDPTKARQELGWVPEISFENMVREMISHDLAAARRSAFLKEHGCAMPEPQER